MQKITLSPMNLRDVADNAGDYPTGFKMPYQSFVRQAFLEKREALIDGAEIAFEFPGVGTLTFKGRAYRFDFLPAYAEAKNYADHVDGNWG